MSEREYPKKSDLEIEFEKISKEKRKSVKYVKFEFAKFMGKEIVSHYLSDNEILNEAPSFTSMRKKYIAIKKASEKLKKSLQELSPSEMAFFISNQDSDYLKSIIHRTNIAIKVFSRHRRGPKKDCPLERFIQDMAWLWEVVMNRKPKISCNRINEQYTGKFLDLVYNLLLSVKNPPHSKNALGKRIQRVLKK